MKKTLLFVVAFGVLMLGLTSCEKKDDNESNTVGSHSVVETYSIVGDWELLSEEHLEYLNGELVHRLYDDEGGICLSVRDDGTYLSVEDYGDDVQEDKGSYTYKNGKLELFGSGEDPLYDVIFITASKIVLKSTFTYTDDENGDKYKEEIKLTYLKVGN